MATLLEKTIFSADIIESALFVGIVVPESDVRYRFVHTQSSIAVD